MAWKRQILLAAALVPTSALHKQPNNTAASSVSGAEDPCTCMTWKNFAMQGLRCPNPLFTPEAFTEVSRQLDVKSAGQKRCELLMKLDSNACINVDDQYAPDSWAENQWCYVSSECKSLNGGRKVDNVKTGVSWKVCGDGDQQLRNKAGEEIADLAQAQKLRPQELVLLAYPTWQKHSWQTLEPKILGPAGLPYKGFKSHVPAELREVFDTGAGLVFKTETYPKYFAKDRKIYRISSQGWEPDGMGLDLNEDYVQTDCVAFC